MVHKENTIKLNCDLKGVWFQLMVLFKADVEKVEILVVKAEVDKQNPQRFCA